MPKRSRHVFSPGYRYKLFLQWFNNGRPGAQVFMSMVNPDETGNMPTKSAIVSWIPKWKQDAEIVDNQIKTELEKRMIKEKVEMLSRHADLGKKMQDIGIEFLLDPENADEITSSTAVRLLVAGVEIERESRGLPDTLEKIINKSDEELIEQLTEITKNEPLEIEAL